LYAPDRVRRVGMAFTCERHLIHDLDRRHVFVQSGHPSEQHRAEQGTCRRHGRAYPAGAGRYRARLPRILLELPSGADAAVNFSRSGSFGDRAEVLAASVAGNGGRRRCVPAASWGNHSSAAATWGGLRRTIGEEEEQTEAARITRAHPHRRATTRPIPPAQVSVGALSSIPRGWYPRAPAGAAGPASGDAAKRGRPSPSQLERLALPVTPTRASLLVNKIHDSAAEVIAGRHTD
jgi:hypothetical protein